MGKGTEHDDRMRERQAEIARGEREDVRSRNNPRPELRLGHELLARAIDSHAMTKDVLDQVTGEGARSVVVLRDAESGATAVTVTVEQYLNLVTSLIRDRGLTELNTESPLAGRLAPSDATFTDLGVEPVNPRDTWLPIPDYDPTQPASE
jgi:peptidyl-tRNA hydrolase